MNTGIKIAAFTLAAIIIILLGLLIFVPGVKSPTLPPACTASCDLVVTLPHAGEIVSSPLAVEGIVTDGGWFFEGSFPIKILDSDGSVIGSGTAQALSDWTSTGTVPFSASIVFTVPSMDSAGTGTIVFTSDNPSGSQPNQRSVSVPIQFK